MFSLISAFSGAGALDYAFRSTRHFSTSGYIELESEFCSTLRLNQSNGLLCKGEVIEDDVAACCAQPLLGRLRRMKPSGLIGGPPCQSFSSIGKQHGRHDPRGMLVFRFADLASSLPVEFFVMENVPGLATIERGAVLRDLIQAFEAGRFQVRHEVLCAADYGAPTTRRRLFIVGFRRPVAFRFPSATHHDPATHHRQGAREWATAGEALKGLPKPSPPGDHRQGDHVAIQHAAKVVERFNKLPPGTWDTVRKRARLAQDRPSPSLIAGNRCGTRSHIHPLEPRELTNRESARIQGFPDTYQFCGSRAEIGIQVANAVPIQLGRAVARQIAQAMRNRKPDAMAITSPRVEFRNNINSLEAR